MDKHRAEFEKAYREAIYTVVADGKEIIFRIGEVSEAINRLLDEACAAKFALVTAFNPRSEVLPDDENETRQVRLKELLRAENLYFLEGYGANERELWEREPSLFIFGISEERAVEIGREFEQNAIVYGEKNEKIKLVWCFENNRNL